MSTFFFERLRAERERLGLTQEQMAAIAGVTRRPYVEWEKGTGPSPNVAQLGGMATAGVDVSYVVTGERTQGKSEMELLPGDERLLIDSYRRCSADARRHLIQTAALLAAGHGADDAAAQGQGAAVVRQRQLGDGAVQIGAVFGGSRVKLPAEMGRQISKRRSAG